MSRQRVLFYVQSLLGVGHTQRALRLARAFAEAGLEVELVSGGAPVPGPRLSGVSLTQLPPLRSADASFSRLVDAAGHPPDEAWKAQRRDALLAAFARARPHALVMETYPFGRRQLGFELLPLLEAAGRARPRPLVVCSIRDILQPKRNPERVAETLHLAERFFDRVLVHGDPRLVRLEETFPGAGELGERVRYTGLVAPPALGAARGEGVLVSHGGGAVGTALLGAALDARPVSALRAAPWRLLAGPHMPAHELAALARRAPAGVLVERARPDFLELLAGCTVSVSQAGYNTVVEILRVGARAVLVPFSAGGEVEQRLRAARLAERGRVRVVDEAALAPAALARAIDAALVDPPPAQGDLDLEGAPQSARLLLGWLAARGGAAA